MKRKIINVLRNSALWLDYLLYFTFNPFKFKKFPKLIRKIIVVEDLLIGDLLVIVPVLRALKYKFDAQIDILVSPKMIDVAESLPYITNVVASNNNLDKGYDLGIILHSGTFKSSLALLRNKIGRASCRERVYVLV